MTKHRSSWGPAGRTLPCDRAGFVTFSAHHVPRAKLALLRGAPLALVAERHGHTNAAVALAELSADLARSRWGETHGPGEGVLPGPDRSFR